MRIEVKDVLGIEFLSVTIQPGTIVEVVGENAAGKSSFAIAAQAVLAHEVNPLGLSTSQSKKMYTRDGAEYGEAVLEDDGSIVTWRPSSGTIETPNSVPVSAPEAVGLIKYTERAGAKERAEQMQSALLPKTDEVESELRAELARYLIAEDVEGVFDLVRARGWEAAEAVYVDRGRQAKREWRDITGRTWGFNVGQDWRPDGWLADFDNLTAQQADERVVEAREALSALHQVKAVSETERAEAEKAQSEIPRLQEKVKQAEVALSPYDRGLSECDRELEEADRNFAKSERILSDARKGQTCPKCDAPLRIVRGAIVIDEVHENIEEMETELASIRLNREKCVHLRSIAVESIAPYREALNEARTKLAVAQQRASKAGEAAPPNHAKALADGESKLERALKTVDLVLDAENATAMHETVVRYTEVAKALGPRGIRSRMLGSSITRLNKGLSKISGITAWPEMKADENGGITWNGRPVQSCSESERWRAQAAMQLTLAALTGSKVVVLDRGDVLDMSQRQANGQALRHVAQATGISVIICTTGTNPMPKHVAEAQWVAVKDGQAV